MTAEAPSFSGTDRLLVSIDRALRTVFAKPSSTRPVPQVPDTDAAATDLTTEERALSAALMRVNHVGEVCAQALYDAQALGASDADLKAQFEAAGREETDHLAWTASRVEELGGHVSRLNPVWYAGAFGLGLIAGRLGARTSLGFVVETERQVEQHLASHLARLPAADLKSRAIVAQMRADEARHADEAEQAGGAPLPAPTQWLMRQAAKVMTTVAHRI